MERVNGLKTLLKSERRYYHPIFPWIRGKLSWKKSALVLSKILRLFVNNLTAADKYSRSIMQNLRQLIQTPLSQKQKTFSGFFIELLKYALNFEPFLKKDESSRLIISEIIDSERCWYLNV